jgi:hypothetical protein
MLVGTGSSTGTILIFARSRRCELAARIGLDTSEDIRLGTWLTAMESAGYAGTAGKEEALGALAASFAEGS